MILLTFLFNTGKAQLNIDTSSFYSIFNTLEINDETIIIIGEAHGVNSTNNTELFIIENLIVKGFKTLYIESGKSEATILNMYLETGDTTLFQYTRAREGSGTYKSFLKSLYRMNNEKKIGLNFKGFDFERPTSVGFLFSNWFFNVEINNIDIDRLSNYLLSIDNVESTTLKQVKMKSLKLQIVLDSIKTSFVEYKDQYKKILNNNFEEFKQIIYNPVEPDFLTRDINFTKSILDDQKEGRLNNSIIITGSNHILYKDKFIPLFLDSLPKKYTVHSFVFIYKNCKSVSEKKKYNSEKQLLKYLTVPNERQSLIQFSIPKKSLFPTNKKNITTIVTELYNQ